jgi:hypothetical protein
MLPPNPLLVLRITTASVLRDNAARKLANGKKLCLDPSSRRFLLSGGFLLLNLLRDGRTYSDHLAIEFAVSASLNQGIDQVRNLVADSDLIRPGVPT